MDPEIPIEILRIAEKFCESVIDEGEFINAMKAAIDNTVSQSVASATQRIKDLENQLNALKTRAFRIHAITDSKHFMEKTVLEREVSALKLENKRLQACADHQECMRYQKEVELLSSTSTVPLQASASFIQASQKLACIRLRQYSSQLTYNRALKHYQIEVGANPIAARAHHLRSYELYTDSDDEDSPDLVPENDNTTNMVSTWSFKTPEWNRGMFLILDPNRPETCPDVTLDEVITKSQAFPCKLPLITNTCKILKEKEDPKFLERNINSAYPVVHENVLFLYGQFIYHKRVHGNSIEKELYKDMDLPQFVDRLLTKRAVTFYGKRDNYMLLNGRRGVLSWHTIGSSTETEPLTLKNCLSYDEIKLSAFLSISSYTYFMNVGDRKNHGVFDKNREKIQDEGVVVGMIGARLVKPGYMDYQDMVITADQNIEENGYGKTTQPESVHHLFSEFFDEPCLSYNEFLDFKKELGQIGDKRFKLLESGQMFDNVVYSKRLTMSLDVLFTEANQRAKEKGTTAVVYVVGFGLGLWKLSNEQDRIFMDTCADRLKTLGKFLHNISDVRFSWIKHQLCGPYKNEQMIPIEGHPLKGIKVHIGKFEPHTKLTGADEGKLLVVSYAWDGNALPGNEYYIGKLSSSGDSACASSTQIAELQNPFINPKVCAANLRIVTADGRVCTWDEYRKTTKIKSCLVIATEENDKKQ